MAELKEIQEFIDKATRQIDILSTIQMSIVDYLGRKSHKFRNEMMSAVLSRDDFREQFTDFTNNTDMPDEIKLEMMRINELINEAKAKMGDNDAELDK